MVGKVSEDFNGNKVLLLKSEQNEPGVSATFTPEPNTNAEAIKIGQTITIKGVIRSGASYNEDMGIYENVTL